VEPKSCTQTRSVDSCAEFRKTLGQGTRPCRAVVSALLPGRTREAASGAGEGQDCTVMARMSEQPIHSFCAFYPANC
jgi:hypothetical protein